MHRKERRKTPRNLIDCPVQLAPLGGSITSDDRSGTEPCIVQDVSAGGARIWSDRHYARDEVLELTFDCTQTGLDGETTCQVTVVWTDTEPTEGRWQMGVRFHEDDGNARLVSDALFLGCGWCERLCPEVGESAADTAAQSEAD